jgi:hypothetical protein
MDNYSHYGGMEHPDTLYRLIRQRQQEFESQADSGRPFFASVLARLFARD